VLADCGPSIFTSFQRVTDISSLFYRKPVQQSLYVRACCFASLQFHWQYLKYIPSSYKSVVHTQIREYETKSLQRLGTTADARVLTIHYAYQPEEK
jgi:hypothetical protein